jgi:hypothetical protein
MSDISILENIRSISSDIEGQIYIAVISTHFALDIVENPPADGLSSEAVALKGFLNSILLALHSTSKNCTEITKLTKQS